MIIFRGPELCRRAPGGGVRFPLRSRRRVDRRARALSESRYRRVRHTKRSADVNHVSPASRRLIASSRWNGVNLEGRPI
jgi:hypothetical protein